MKCMSERLDLLLLMCESKATTLCKIMSFDLLIKFDQHVTNNNIISKIGQSDVNLTPLALPCSRIPLVQGGVYCIPCDGWAFGFPVK